MDSYMSGAGLIATSAALAVFGLLAVRRRIDARTLVSCHEVGGYLLSVVGTLYAVLLGLIVVDAMNTFQEAHQTTVQEANALGDIVLLARHMPEPDRTRLVRLTSEYAGLVVGPERAAMDHGQYSPEARRAVLALIDTIMKAEPRDDAAKSLHDQQVGTALQLWNSRRARIAVAARGIPALEWVALVVGGVITVFFTYFFAIENLRVQALMTATVAVLISLNIYLVLMFGYPLSGDLRIDLSCFQQHCEIFEPGPGPGSGSGPAPLAR
jgi:hypothetical protein